MKGKIILFVSLISLSFQVLAEDSLGGTLSYKDKSGATGSIRLACAKRKKEGDCARFNINGNNDSVNPEMIKHSCQKSEELNDKKIFFIDSKRQKERMIFSQNVYGSTLQEEAQRECKVFFSVCLIFKQKSIGKDKRIKNDFSFLFDDSKVGQEKQITRAEWSSLLCGLTLK